MATAAQIPDCPSENTLTDFMEGRLSAVARAAVYRHLDDCSACRALISDLARAELESSDSARAAAAHGTPLARVASAKTATAPSSQRFELLRKLGQGGMGVVYEAHDRLRNQRVACKTLRSMSAESLLRFKNEFRALQDVQHQNLVNLGDLVEESGQWWFTMELVQGVDFLTFAQDETRLRAGLAQLAAGLHALHCANKVHRDIKPQNVLVTSGGRVVILDFGLIGEVEQIDSVVVGTAAYMAPEQAAGKSIEPASDWYSVGVMLYEALTGQRPFSGLSLPAITLKVRAEVIPPRTRKPEVPADLDALCMELLDPDPTQRPPGAEVMRRLQSAQSLSEKPAPPIGSSPFVGRQIELAELRDAFARSRAGLPMFVIIEGESGIGKSALLQQFVVQLQQGARDAVVLAGRCDERETVPYKAFDGIVDALSRFLKRLAKSEVAAILPQRSAALLQAFPVLGQVDAIAAVPPGPVETADPAELRDRVFTALRELFARLAERQPLVLTIDDLQWADADSIAMLGRILEPPDAPAVLLLATARALEEVRPAGWDAALRRIREIKKLPMGPLPPAEARALATRLLAKNSAAVFDGHRELAESLAAESGGHPLFIDALTQHATSRDPQTTSSLRLDDALAASIDRMDTGARGLLSLLTVAGRPIGHKTLAAAAALDADEFSRIERVLRIAHMIRGLPSADSPRSGIKEPNLLEPYHDRVRQTLLGRLLPDELSACHQQLAAVLEASGQAEPEALALHFQGANDLRKAARYRLLAADRAAQALAFAHAARLYESALSLAALEPAETNRAQVGLGEMLSAAGRPREAARAFLAAAETADVSAQLRHKQRAAALLLQNGAFADGQAILADVLAAVDVSSSNTGWSAILRFIWLRLRLLLRGLRYRERAAGDISQRELLRVDACWAAALGQLFYAPLQAMALHAQHLLLALEVGEPMRLARALAFEALLRNFADRRQWKKADDLLAQSQRLGRQIGSSYVLGLSTLVAAVVAFHRGRLRGSIELAQAAEKTLQAHCPAAAWELGSCRGLITITLGMMGRYKELASVLPALVQSAQARGDVVAESSGQIWLLMLHLAHDELERAREIAADLRQLVSSTGSAAHESNFINGEALLTFYAQPDQALTRFDAEWLPRVRRSPLRASQPSRIWTLCTEATARLFAHDTPQSRRRIHGIARQLARAKEALPVGQSLAIRAALAHRLGNLTEAVQLAAQAEQLLQAAEYSMHAAAARYRQGQYLGDEVGKALRDSAVAAMSQEGIKDPEKFARALLP